jgi:hypothetical protein
VEIDSAVGYSGRWEPIDYDDHRGNRVHDAEPVETLCQEGTLTKDGCIWTEI